MQTDLMRKIFLIPLIFLFFLSKFALAFHDVEVANEDVAALGGLWTQIYVYEEYCADNQYYEVILDRLPNSPRVDRYSSELDHLTNDQELAWERGGLGASAVISAGETDCDTMATVIWEWFGEN